MIRRESHDGYEDVLFVHEPDAGLRAIIAVHSTRPGPALGGCRMWPYASEDAALTDVLRLSRGMSYKNAVAGLPIGGGKSVIIGDPREHKTPELLYAFGRAVDTLQGRYVTAEDVGMTEADMMMVATQTGHVAGLPTMPAATAAGGDPSPMTALGVLHGIHAAARFALGKRDLRGLRVAVQGLGSVGRKLCQHLHEAGAQLVVSDIDASAMHRAATSWGARCASPKAILFEDVDILAPCALGGILNATTIPRLSAPIVAGAANNQLLTDDDGELLRACGVLYAPDYVINAGGVINAAAEYLENMTQAHVLSEVARIEDRLLQIFEASRDSNTPTNQVADALARKRLAVCPTGEPLAFQASAS